jgi:hypothetical protein
MQDKSVLAQARVMFALILLNFAAQVPYFVHLYLGRQALAVTLRSFLIMGAVFAWFLAGAILLARCRHSGYGLMVAFLAVEFLFYLLGSVNSTLRGFGPFFQVRNPDVVLRVIYSIGYVNLFAAGYFLSLLLRWRSAFLPE